MAQSNTIVALSTGRGGAISLIRLSGDLAISITDNIFYAKKGKTLAQTDSYRAVFGEIRDQNSDLIDEVLVTIFRNPKSYTGEDMVEISCHASLYIEQQIIELLLEKGAAAAAPGEFTQRAYLNGKLDLVQAEAVADIIASSSKASHRLALNQMRGSYSKEFTSLRDKLLNLTTLLELELDFSEEDVEFADRSQLKTILSEVISKIESLISSFRDGNAIKNGVATAIVGAPNVGKSTLLNALVKHERAIVSHIAGTTRDSVEESIVIGGVLFRFIDTAGIRETNDYVESIGIDRTFQNMAKATLVIVVLDPMASNAEIIEQLKQISLEEWQKMVVVINKSDLASSERMTEISSLLSDVLPSGTPLLPISAKENCEIKSVETTLGNLYNQTVTSETVAISNIRHIELLKQALDCSLRAMNAINNNLPNDLTATDTRQTITHLSSLIGEITTTDILINIFSNFCIGK